MLTYNPHIQDFIKPLVYETQKAEWVSMTGYFVKFFNFIINSIKKRLNTELDKLILMLEGFIPHISNLPSESAIKELQSIKIILKDLIKVTDKLKKIDFFDDNELEDKFSYSLNLIYQTESKLHKAVYKNKPVQKTSDDLIDGVMRMNGKYANELLSL